MDLRHKRGVQKNIFSLCICLLISGLVWSQEVVASELEGSVRAMESQMLIVETSPSAADTISVEGSSYGVWFFVRTVLVLAVVIALIWGFFMFLKKTSGAADSSDPYLKKVAALTLAPGKFVYVVTLKSKAYLVGVADNSVSLIAEIDDQELIDAMNLNAPQGFEGRKHGDFTSILGKFVNAKGKNYAATKGTGNDFSTSGVVELLKNQRSRLNVSEGVDGKDDTP